MPEHSHEHSHEHEDSLVFPVAPRLRDSDRKPHVGPHRDDYEKHHALTVGEHSDKFWDKKHTLESISALLFDFTRKLISFAFALLKIYRLRKTPFIGTDPSKQSVPEASSTVTSSGSPKAVSMRHTTASTAGRTSTPTRPRSSTRPTSPERAASSPTASSSARSAASPNVLKDFGVNKGDTISIYLPMTWHAAAAFLACARIGAVHSVVFAGFSAESLRDRVRDCASRVLITTDEGRRGGKTIATKAIVDAALKECPGVAHVLVLRRTGKPVPWTQGRDKWWHEEAERVQAYCPPEVMSAEDPLFILYTSGSTGKPKGVVHTTGGYLLGAALTVKYVFDVHPDDKFACMADVGWITGHTYIVYGPLANGITTTIFESTPVYPTPARYWQHVQEHKITQFYSAPTAIRLLRRLGHHHVAGHDLSSLRVLGSVGEPINPEAWHWYNEHVGRGQCAIVDTFWQTETGSIVVTPFPGAIETKPGAATVPFFGIETAILDPQTGALLEGNGVEGVLVIRNPWPSLARTVYGDHKRYLETYMKPYPGFFYTGDGAARDKDGYIWIKGRVDGTSILSHFPSYTFYNNVSHLLPRLIADVINVSGHRLSTAEIESALILHTGGGGDGGDRDDGRADGAGRARVRDAEAGLRARGGR
ncbi:hypothetical protein EW145_g8117, partial [Phellinidium pouzarii]